MTNNNSTAKVIVFSILFGILLLIGAILIFSKQENSTLPIKLEEFADYQCPACSIYYFQIKTLLTEFGGDVEYQYRHFIIHDGSYQASLASEAAREQGKFDEYSALLFQNYDSLHTDNFINFAQSLDLNLQKFEIDMNSEMIKKRVDEDIKEANKRLVNATPTFFINGKKVVFKENEDPIPQLRQILTEKILSIKNTNQTDNSKN